MSYGMFLGGIIAGFIFAAWLMVVIEIGVGWSDVIDLLFECRRKSRGNDELEDEKHG